METILVNKNEKMSGILRQWPLSLHRKQQNAKYGSNFTYFESFAEAKNKIFYQ